MILYEKLYSDMPKRGTIKNLKTILGRNYKLKSCNWEKILKEMIGMGYDIKYNKKFFEK